MRVYVCVLFAQIYGVADAINSLNAEQPVLLANEQISATLGACYIKICSGSRAIIEIVVASRPKDERRKKSSAEDPTNSKARVEEGTCAANAYFRLIISSKVYFARVLAGQLRYNFAHHNAHTHTHRQTERYIFD